VDPIKPMSKAPGIKRFEAEIQQSAFKFCFQILLALLQLGARDPHPRIRRPAPGAAAHLGMPVQLDPIKPTLKPPGTKRLNL
jgi:hypothetical protein